MPYFTAPLRPQPTYYQHDPSAFLNPFLAALLADQLPSPSAERAPSPPRRSNTTAGSENRANKKPKTSMSGAAPAKPNPTPRQPHRNLRAFTPNFDVYESDSAYTLEGDLPGLSNKKAIDIEFSDDRTLMIRGKVERTIPVEKSERRSLKPTVEDTDDEDDYSVISGSDKEKEEKKRKEEEKEEVVGEMKTWLSERTFGTFQRSFEFPTPVKVEEVKASLEAGVLRIVVPKVGMRGVRKIEID